jgi:adenosylmethionine-8-amino-7-oxononanoate aminotransferase
VTRGAIVTGTDTGVGKTVVCAALLAALGARATPPPRRYWKPVQTGSPPDDDAAEVARLAGLSPEEVVPGAVRLRLPASPFEAGLAEGVAVRLPRALPAAPPDAVWVVEGAGGLLVPLSAHEVLADAFAGWGLPLVVVARPEVGTLNHTLLTLEAARRRGLEVLAVVVSRPPTAAVLAALRSLGGVEPVVLPDLAAPRDESPGSQPIRLRPRLVAIGGVVERMAAGRGGPAGGRLVERDARAVWHPYTQHGTGAEPLAVTAAEGAWLTLEGGRRVLDATSSWWTTLHGHGHPAIAAAIARQARALDHVLFAGATHEPAVALAERLLGLAPPGLGRVFYSDDGSTAVETALKMAVAFHARRGDAARTGFAALEEGYHGDTAGAMSVSADGPFTADFRALRFPCARVPAPVRGRAVGPCLDALDDLLAREGRRLAALVVEPLLMGAGGMLVTPPEFLRGVRERTRAHGVLLVADEVFTGFSRTGSVFACGRAGVTPDLLVVAKALTGGTLTLAATLATGEVWEAFRSARREDAFLHGHSYTANPVACAAALASLDLLVAGGCERAEAIGRRLGEGLEPLRGRRGVREVRGIGPVRAVELADEDGRGYLSGVAPRLAAIALEHDVLLRPLGPVLYALPPLCVTDAECDRVAAAMRAAVEAVLPA